VIGLSDEDIYLAFCQAKLFQFVSSGLRPRNGYWYTFCVTDHFGISKNTLQQIMKRQTNSTFFYYIEKKRMKIAKDFLLYTSTPISE